MKITRFIPVVLAALAVALFADVRAEDAPAPESPAEPAKAVQVDRIEFADVAEAVKLDKLPEGVQPLAKAIAQDFPGAKFVFSEGPPAVLTVDISKLRGSINPLSDCPDNTQFHVEFTKNEKAEKVIECVTVAWTRLRHAAPDAKVRTVNISDRDAGAKNYDVQLNLPPRLSRTE